MLVAEATRLHAFFVSRDEQFAPSGVNMLPA